MKEGGEGGKREGGGTTTEGAAGKEGGGKSRGIALTRVGTTREKAQDI